MPTKDEKLYIKGYRIYRADEMQHGKGTAILVSNLVEEADMDKISQSNNGRYVTVNLRRRTSTTETTIESIEPDMEIEVQIIPHYIKLRDNWGKRT